MSGQFRIFDFNFTSSFPFQTPLPVALGEPELMFALTENGDAGFNLSEAHPRFDNSNLIEGNENQIKLYVLDGLEIVRIGSKITFLIRDDVIQCTIEDQELLWLAELSFLGLISSFWLERQGLTVLHGAAVLIDNSITAFLGDNGAGKSSLAASFLETGHSFVTDDVLPIELRGTTFMGRPSYPSLRLWPVDAHRMSGSNQLRRVQPFADKRRGEVGREFAGNFTATAAPLRNIFVIERRAGVTETFIEVLSPAQSLIELVRNSFIPRLVMAMGWQRRRLDSFVDLLGTVTVRRLVYPDGIEHLPSVRDFVLTQISEEDR